MLAFDDFILFYLGFYDFVLVFFGLYPVLKVNKGAGLVRCILDVLRNVVDAVLLFVFLELFLSDVVPSELGHHLLFDL